MKNITTKEALAQCVGASFNVIGPFLVADLSSQKSLFKGMQVGMHGMEKLMSGQKTESHTHEFPSFYKSEGLNIESEGSVYILPKQAITLVLPGTSHSWQPKENTGSVGSVDSRHEKQVIAA